MGNVLSEIALTTNNRLLLEVNKQYIFRRVIGHDGSHPFFLGDTDQSTGSEGWKASASSNIEVTLPIESTASRLSGITTWQSVGLKIHPSFNADPNI